MVGIIFVGYVVFGVVKFFDSVEVVVVVVFVVVFGVGNREVFGRVVFDVGGVVYLVNVGENFVRDDMVRLVFVVVGSFEV